MKKLIILIMLFIGTSQVLADGHSTTVRLGTEGAYPPYNFINDAGEVDGFERELGDALCKRLRLKCEWVVNDWDSIIPNLVSGNYDVIIAGMSYTEERDQTIDFSEGYIPAEPSAYLALDADIDVADALVTAQSATIHAAFVAEQGWDLIEFPSPEDTIAAVLNGEADAVLADYSFLKDYEGDDGLIMLERKEILGGGVALGVRESDKELRRKLNGAISAMKADGSLNAMITKWEVGETW